MISIRVSRSWLRIALPAAALLLLLAGAGFAALESDTVGSFWEGLWWSLALMTTVGFIDGEPASVAGRMLAAALMVTGFSLLALTTAAVASLLVHEDEAPEERALRAFEANVLAELRQLREQLERLESRSG